MSTISTSSMGAELNQAMLRSWVEKPPRPTAEKAWQMASNQDMPHTLSAMMPAAVSSAYTEPQVPGGLGDARREALVLHRPGAWPL